MTKINKYTDSMRRLVAIHIPAEYSANGVEFVTEPENSLQLAVMTRPEGEEIPSHYHNPGGRIIKDTQETLFLRKGVLEVSLYDQKQEKITVFTMGAGDILLLASGGHGFRVVETADLVEIKQGPYSGPFDKTVFYPRPDFDSVTTTTTPSPNEPQELRDGDESLSLEPFDTDHSGETPTTSPPTA